MRRNATSNPEGSTTAMLDGEPMDCSLDDGLGLCLVDIKPLRRGGAYVIHVWWSGAGLSNGESRKGCESDGELHGDYGGDKLVVCC